MAVFTIPPLTIPAGDQAFGPFTVPAGFTTLDFTLDIANLVSADVLIEVSTDGGATYRHVVSETGLTVGINHRTGLPITTERLEARWAAGVWPSGLMRVTITNAVAFTTAGGSLTVS